MTRTAHPGPRFAAAGLIGVGVVAILAAASVFVGARGLSPAEVVDAITGAGTPEAAAIVGGQRVPRTVVGLIGGAALGVAGALIQGHTRNPLADPGLLGVTSGASVAVVVGLSFFGLTGSAGILISSLVGAAAATVLVGVLGAVAGRKRDASPAVLVLAGAALSAFLGSATGILLLMDSSALDIFRFWTVGSLASGSRTVDLLPLVGPLLVAGFLLALPQLRVLDALALGEDTARSLGRNLKWSRIAGLASIASLAGGATAIIGAVSFVGLAAPHIVRGLVGRDYRRVVPLSAPVGAALVLAADIIGRIVVQPAELAVGVVLGIVGGPVFLLLVYRLYRRRK